MQLLIIDALLFNCRILPRGNKRKLSPMLVWTFDSLKTILKLEIDFENNSVNVSMEK